jgi:hypothetical protein
MELDLKDIAIELANATLVEDFETESRCRLKIQMMVLDQIIKFGTCYSTLETLADFADDDAVSIVLYRIAIAEAMHSQQDSTSAQFSLAQLLINGDDVQFSTLLALLPTIDRNRLDDFEVNIMRQIDEIVKLKLDSQE